MTDINSQKAPDDLEETVLADLIWKMKADDSLTYPALKKLLISHRGAALQKAQGSGAGEANSLIANLAAVVRIQNGNQHDDINALLASADKFLSQPPEASEGEAEKCRVCGSDSLSWQTMQSVRNGIMQNRLNTNDVECIFFLGCDSCSETLRTITAEQVAQQMTQATPPKPEASALRETPQRGELIERLRAWSDNDCEYGHIGRAEDLTQAADIIAALAKAGSGEG